MKKPDFKALRNKKKSPATEQRFKKRASERWSAKDWFWAFRQKWKDTHTPANRRAWSKVQTAVCMVLLALNILLLAVSGAAKAQELLQERRVRSQMDAMLAQQGMLCGSSVYHTLENCPQVYTLRADSSIQKTFARNLLTGTIVTVAKGSNTVWTGDNGTVEWSQSGELYAEADLPTVVRPQSEDDAGRIVQDMLEQAGIIVRKDQVTVTQREANYIVTVRQEINKTELLGCKLTVTIAERNVFTIEGTWCTGTAEPMTIQALENYSAQKTLFQFVASKKAVGQIISVQPAYVLSDKSGGRFTTIPCWRFSTDSGDFVLNILTGEVVASSELEGTDTAEDETDDDTTQQDTSDTEIEDPDTTDVDENPANDAVDETIDDTSDIPDTAVDPITDPQNGTTEDTDGDEQDIPYDERTPDAGTEDIWNADG